MSAAAGVPEAISDAVGAASVRVQDGTGTDRRWRLYLHHACRIYDRGWVHSRHPNAHLVLLKQIGHKLVEVDVRISVVVVREFVIVPTNVSAVLGAGR